MMVKGQMATLFNWCIKCFLKTAKFVMTKLWHRFYWTKFNSISHWIELHWIVFYIQLFLTAGKLKLFTRSESNLNSNKWSHQTGNYNNSPKMYPLPTQKKKTFELAFVFKLELELELVFVFEVGVVKFTKCCFVWNLVSMYEDVRSRRLSTGQTQIRLVLGHTL